MIEIIQYETGEGACPFADWFESLDTRAALKVRTALARMEAGNFGDVKPVGEGVVERRIDVGPGYRVYFGWVRLGRRRAGHPARRRHEEAPAAGHRSRDDVLA